LLSMTRSVLKTLDFNSSRLVGIDLRNHPYIPTVSSSWEASQSTAKFIASAERPNNSFEADGYAAAQLQR